MFKFKRLFLITLLASAPVFAFDFGNKMDQFADSFSNKLFDKAVDGVNSSLDGEPEQKAQANTKASKNNKMQQLKELVEMKKQGYITEQEFKAQKKLILSQK